MKITITAKQEKKSVQPTNCRYVIEMTTQTGVNIRGEIQEHHVLKEEFDRYHLGQVLFEG